MPEKQVREMCEIACVYLRGRKKKRKKKELLIVFAVQYDYICETCKSDKQSQL